PTANQQAILKNIGIKLLRSSFDCAYQGLASGDLDHDAWAVRYIVEKDMLVCQ
ncbi:aspartate aminotransferase, partial [Suillus paluster]|uniref:aspartate aminotransferase n=1 Tax=Suillus paluster TaxID=48578 RepID=UPI001B86C376